MAIAAQGKYVIPNMSKHQWMEENKKIIQAYKLEERSLIQAFFGEDFHLNKIYQTLLRDDVENEKKLFEDSIKNIKSAINDVFEYFKGGMMVHKATKNLDIRAKISKIEDALIKNRIEYKNKFENLLLEEEILEKELNEFSNSLQNPEENIDDQSDLQNQNPTQEQIPQKTETKKEKIEEYIHYVLNSANIIFDNDFTINEIIKYLKNFTPSDLELLKSKTSIIDQIIDTSLGGPNLSWQPREHQDFLKLRCLHNNKINSFEFLNDLSNTLPFLPTVELKNHIKLFNKFYQLIELKKLLISKYKELKAIKDSDGKKALLEQLVKEDKPKPKREASTNAEKKKMLEEWKLKKVLEKKEKFEDQLKMKKEKIVKERLKYNEKKEKIKPMLDEYKMKKQMEQVISCNPPQKETYINEIDVERIKEREEKLIEQKKMNARSKSFSNFKKAENYVKFRMKHIDELEKIEHKIEEKTEGYNKKIRNKFDKAKDNPREACTMGGNVLGRMTRAIPEWRKGVI